MREFEERVRAVIERLRPGDVVTYGEVAEEAGHPGAARAVGNVLAASDGLPWWRVVASSGRLVRGHEREQARRLRAEGTRVEDGRIRGRVAPTALGYARDTWPRTTTTRKKATAARTRTRRSGGTGSSSSS